MKTLLLLMFLSGNSISPVDLGAKCDGVTDDTIALRATVAAADTAPYRKIKLPPSTCVFSGQLVFGGRTDRYSDISMEGSSEYQSYLNYVGPNNQAAIVISHMAAFHWSGFTLTNGGTRGTSQGILLTGPFGTGGTMNPVISFDHVAVTGWHTGILAGDADAASEITCHQCIFSYNDVGWTSSGYNSLNFWFEGLHLLNNVHGVQLGGPWVSDAIHVRGGSSHGNTVDFYAGNSFGELSIQDFRAEIDNQNGSLFMDGSAYGAFPQVVDIRDSTIIGTNTAIPVTKAGGDTAIRFIGCVIAGQISATWLTAVPPNSSTLRIEGTQVVEGTPGYPVLLPSSGVLKLNLTNNMRYNGFTTQSWFPDVISVWQP